MIVVLLVDGETGNMQFSLEGGTPEVAVKAMKIAIRQIEAQTGIVSVEPVTPPPPTPRNVREIIVPDQNGMVIG